jgi:D-alanine transaminase
MTRIAYVNGQYVPHNDAAVHIEDRGYQFADGVYEVFTIHQSKLIGEKGHIDRLTHSLKELNINWPVSRRVLGIICREVVRRNKLKNGIIYLQITRGVARRDHPFPKNTKSALVLTARQAPPLDKVSLLEGASVITIPDIRWKRPDIKSISLLPNVLGKQKARESGAYEAWLVNEDGFITEGTSSNAWIVTKDGDLVTHNVSNTILNGITRLSVLETAEKAGIKFIERPFSLDEALIAKEAFITSSSSHVKAVTNLNGKAIGNGHVGELTTRLLNLYVRFIEDEGGPQKTTGWN